MADKEDPQKTQKDLMDAMKNMMGQQSRQKDAESERIRKESDEDKIRKRESILEFNLKPHQVKQHLDRFIIKQDEAKRVLATAVCDHYNHVKACVKEKKCENYVKQNIVMLGPSGVGKTYLVRHLADLIGVPFVKADATKFSETGYVGGDVDDLARDLVQKADGDIELAQYGMIYLDEVDKISGSANLAGRDVSGKGVQRGLLKIMEETEVPLRSPHDLQSQFESVMEYQKKGKLTKPIINTKHILLIVSGAFDGLSDIIDRRLKKGRIGFRKQTEDPQLPQNLLYGTQTHDFIEFGFEPEFIGRLPVRVVCDQLTEEDLYTILTTSEESILKQYVAAFKAYGIDIKTPEQALWEISKIAGREKTGARGLLTVFEKVFRNLKYELPSSHLKEFTVTKEMVKSPKESHKELLKEERLEKAKIIEDGIRRFEEDFFQKNNIRITCDESAVQAIQDEVLDEGQDVEKMLHKRLSNYHYGLGLVQQKKPRDKFVLTCDAIKNPNACLDLWIKEAYEG